jgi:mRNA interferase MazF
VDWVLCQVTSNPYGDSAAVPLHVDAFAAGGLNRVSFARPGKLFTASETIMVRVAGTLSPGAHRDIIEAVINVLRSGLH